MLTATPEILSQLAGLLGDANSAVREAAGKAVRELGSAAATPEFLSRLAELLGDENQAVCGAACWAVCSLGPAAAIPEILSRLVERLVDADDYVRLAAAHTLLQFKNLRYFQSSSGNLITRSLEELAS